MRVTPSQPTLSVAILTYNGEEYLRRILEALRAQEYQRQIELLIIDSGSTDHTLDIIASFPEVKLTQIPNSEFGHGRTRNLAANLATGDIIAYLTHDAVPASAHWAAEIVAPFAISERVVAVMGKQIPRSHCFPLLKYEISGVFAGLGGDLGPTLYELSDTERTDEGILAAKAFYSDVNSAARRDFLVNTIAYRDVNYAEDQIFGRDLLEAGYIKAYAPGAAVEHSNDLTLAEYGPRIFDETVALREIGRDVQPLKARTRLRLTVRGIIGDTVRILRDPAYSLPRKLYWMVRNPFYHLRKWKYHNLGATADLTARESNSQYSLENRRKIGAQSTGRQHVRSEAVSNDD